MASQMGQPAPMPVTTYSLRGVLRASTGKSSVAVEIPSLT
jgi:hypothetical protein